MFFLPQLGGGGAEMNAVRLAPGLLAAGVTPIYAVARGPGSFAEFLPEGTGIEVLDTGGIDSSTLRLVRARRPLARLLDSIRPDILCPVMAAPALAALGALSRVRHRPPVVLSIQNSLSVSHEQSRRLRDRVELALIRRMFPRADGVIALSQGVAAELRRIVPALSDRVSVVHNVGMPLSTQREPAMRIPKREDPDTITILACGRLSRQKDYPTLLRSFARLEPAGSLRLQILGDGELRDALTELSGELGIADRVRFLGFQRDPITHMRRADIFVLSSIWEGFGNVIVEAMSVGTPVVATACPHGPSEIITNGDDGLLVEPGDVAGLAAAIQKLVDDSALRRRMGAAGLRRAEDFTSERIAGAFVRDLRAFAGLSP